MNLTEMLTFAAFQWIITESDITTRSTYRSVCLSRPLCEIQNRPTLKESWSFLKGKKKKKKTPVNFEENVMQCSWLCFWTMRPLLGSTTHTAFSDLIFLVIQTQTCVLLYESPSNVLACPSWLHFYTPAVHILLFHRGQGEILLQKKKKKVQRLKSNILAGRALTDKSLSQTKIMHELLT